MKSKAEVNGGSHTLTIFTTMCAITWFKQQRYLEFQSRPQNTGFGPSTKTHD